MSCEHTALRGLARFKKNFYGGGGVALCKWKCRQPSYVLEDTYFFCCLYRAFFS